MNTAKNRNSPKRLKIALFVLGICFSGYLALNFLFLPFVGKGMVEKKLSETLHRKVSIGSIHLNPFLLALDIQKVRIERLTQGQEEFVSFDSCLVDISPRKIFTPALFVSKIELKKPKVFITRNSDQTFNFSDLASSPDKEDKKEAKHIFPLVARDINLDNGQLIFTDNAGKAVHKLQDIKISLKQLSTLPIKDAEGESQPSVAVSGKIEIKNFSINHDNLGELVAIDNVSLSLRDSNLLDKNIIVDELALSSPRVQVLCDKENRFPLLSMLRPAGTENIKNNEMPGVLKKEPENEAQNDKALLALILDRLAIDNGSLNFIDTPRNFSVKVSPLQFSLANLALNVNKKTSSLSGSFSLDMQSQAKENLTTTGTFSWDAKDSLPTLEARVKASAIRAERYAPYYDRYLPYTIDKAGINLEASISTSSSRPGMSITGNFLEIKDLLMLEKSESHTPMLEIPSIRMGETKILIDSKKIILGQIETQKGKVFVTKNTDGTTNFSSPFAVESKSGQTITNPDNKSFSESDPLPKKTESPWQVSLASLSLENYELAFKDLMTPEPLSIDMDNVNIKTGKINFTGKEKSDLQMGFSWADKGKVEVKGGFCVKPFSTDLDMVMENIDLASVSPYLENQLKARIIKGAAQIKGQIIIDTGSSKNKFIGRGDICVNNFKTIDTVLSKQLFAWQKLDTSGINLTTSPFSLDIKKITLNDFFSQASISEEGQINFKQLLVKKEGEKPSAKPNKTPKTSPNISIGTIELNNGEIAFSDNSVSPHFQSGITGIKGSISGISSNKKKLAKIDLNAIQRPSSPLAISGQINPFSQNFLLDIKTSLSDMEMTHLTPYSGKYLARKIDKGKLGMDLKYNIRGSKLKAENNLILDQFTLGEKVKSKDAVSLPLDLAITLLKDPKGKIKMNVPVSGDLTDPSFRLGSVIFRVIQNLIIKTVSAPFSILGSMVGKGEELGYVTFTPGDALLAEAEKAKLDSLAKALGERESLRLEIKGLWDEQLDKHGLGEILFENNLKAMKIKSNRNVSADTLGQVEMTSQEREKYIEKAWENKTFDYKGQEDSLDLAKKQSIMIENIKITESNLRNLAMKRGINIKEYLLSLDLISENRLFLLEPRPSDISAKNQDHKVRVDFSIK